MIQEEFFQNGNNDQIDNEQNLIKEKIIDAKGGCTVLCLSFLFLITIIPVLVLLSIKLNSIEMYIISAIIGFLSFFVFFFYN